MGEAKVLETGERQDPARADSRVCACAMTESILERKQRARRARCPARRAV